MKTQIDLVVTLVKSILDSYDCNVVSREELSKITTDTCTILEFTEDEIVQMIREVECQVTFSLEVGTLIK